MTSPPLPDAFLKRLSTQNLYDKIIPHVWDGNDFIRGIKTVMLYGDPAIQNEAIREMELRGFAPQIYREWKKLGIRLVTVSTEGKSFSDLLSYQVGLLYPQEANGAEFYADWLESLSDSWNAPHILDFCAGPGGKAAMLAWAVKCWGGRLVANEPVSDRFGALVENLRRCGAPAGTQVSRIPHHKIPQEWKNCFDVLVIDAPCSGEGLLRKEKHLGLSFWSENSNRRAAKLQHSIIESVVPCSKKPSHILYSTCTFAKEENEDIVESMCSRFSLNMGQSELRCPKQGKPGEGFFGCTLTHRTGGLGLHKEISKDLEIPRVQNLWKPLELSPDLRLSTVREASAPPDFHGDLESLPPTLESFALWSRKKHEKKGKSRIVTWRHRVLEVEWEIGRGKTLFRTLQVPMLAR